MSDTKDAADFPLLAGSIGDNAPIFKPAPPLLNDATGNKKYFFCSVPAATMNRWDGRRIVFNEGIYGTDVKGDIQYLEAEIAAGHQYLKVATPEQIQQYRLATDFRGTIRNEVIAEERDRIVREVTEQLSAEFDTAIAQVQHDAGSDVNLSGVDLKSRLAALATLKSGTGVVKLGGIQSSADVASAAAGSASGKAG